MHISSRYNQSIDLIIDDDIIDWNVNQFDKESDKAHDGKADGGCDGNFLELFAVWFRATTNQTDGVAGKLFARVDEGDDLIHG